ncbi:hypothetical protein ABAC460_12785 [Asticcacaulis sp. AC460]|uniref:hypothetical protein n=1 Tax=Asticcacaulis sp. AC460 TaxID=1282360 RepID=UPI0003C3BECB|nr:hypothetical protein [Asticcacaulis sp. AC460]ESQ89380.1 hypothetical protein ABAC460_12785 [Asticcacaulis sp. AC460]
MGRSHHLISKRILLVLALGGLSLSGCEHMYGGVDASVANVGAVKRADNLYDVVYLGNDKTTPEYRRAMAMKQSAELCKAQGFQYVKASDTQVFSTFETPEKVPSNEAPQVTLQVSCHSVEDAGTAVAVDSVIAEITSQYTTN